MLVRRALSADLDAVRRLMRAFVEWHHQRHADDLAMVAGYFDPAAFEAELAGLPGKFARPTGDLLVADDDGAVVGCVAMKGLDSTTCEMKRLFVQQSAHGTGAGRALAEAIIDSARQAGYRRMVLDTGPLQHEAQGLYRSLGFNNIEPYYDVASPLREWLVYMGLDL
jgi:GNAT superfamily N-acetyltransferase